MTDGRYELFQWKGYVLRYKMGRAFLQVIDIAFF